MQRPCAAAVWAAAAAAAITPMWTDPLAPSVWVARARIVGIMRPPWAKQAHFVTAGQMTALVCVDTACDVSVAPEAARGFWAAAECATAQCATLHSC